MEGNSEKNSYKIQVIIKTLSGIIFGQNGISLAEKEKKNFTPEFCSYPTRGRKFEIKNIKKIQKIKKVNSDIISVQNGLGKGRNEKKKIYSLIPFILDLCKEIPKKKS